MGRRAAIGQPAVPEVPSQGPSIMPRNLPVAPRLLNPALSSLCCALHFPLTCEYCTRIGLAHEARLAYDRNWQSRIPSQGQRFADEIREARLADLTFLSGGPRSPLPGRRLVNCRINQGMRLPWGGSCRVPSRRAHDYTRLRPELSSRESHSSDSMHLLPSARPTGRCRLRQRWLARPSAPGTAAHLLRRRTPPHMCAARWSYRAPP